MPSSRLSAYLIGPQQIVVEWDGVNRNKCEILCGAAGDKKTEALQAHLCKLVIEIAGGGQEDARFREAEFLQQGCEVKPLALITIPAEGTWLRASGVWLWLV